MPTLAFMPEAAVLTEDLARRFGDVRAVDGVSLAVQPGEIYGFLGPNGAGKTTLIRTLCTLLDPTGGTARVAGYDVVSQRHQVRIRIGVALQEAALDPVQTGAELLRLQGRLYGLRAAELRTRVAEVGRMIDLGDALTRRIGTYSGGMKRRLDLAAALIHNPQVLFLDEPTTGLDPVSRMRVWEEVRKLRRDLGVTIFLTTQYLEEADELADRVGIINAGKLVAEGTPAELKRSVGRDVIVARLDDPSRVAETVRGISGVIAVDLSGSELLVSVEDGAAAIGPVAAALHGSGAPVQEIVLRTATLDDVFFEVTGARIEAGHIEPAAAGGQESNA